MKNIAGQRIHGTTKMKPLVRFTECEKAALSPLPAAAYDLAVWKEATVQRDCYVVFENAYYSVPFRLVGEKVWVRGGLNSVGIYVDYQLVASHLRATEAGQRTTQVDHLPPAKVGGLIQTREVCQEQAAQIGRSTAEVVARLLAERPVDRLPMVHRILSLSKTYGPARPGVRLRPGNSALRGLQSTHDPPDSRQPARFGGIARLLNLESAKPFFARAPEDFLPGLGGVSWN